MLMSIFLEGAELMQIIQSFAKPNRKYDDYSLSSVIDQYGLMGRRGGGR